MRSQPAVRSRSRIVHLAIFLLVLLGSGRCTSVDCALADTGCNPPALWLYELKASRSPRFTRTNGRVAAARKFDSTSSVLAGLINDSDQLGSSVTTVGDVNGDGFVDLAVGAFGDDDGAGDAGALYVLFLDGSGTPQNAQKISDTVGGFTDPLVANVRFAASLTGPGDLDGDGTPDLMVGSSNDDNGGAMGEDRGAMYVFFLNPDGTVKSEQKINNIAGGFSGGLAIDDRFGTGSAAGPDIDGDGVPDLFVGSPQDDDGGVNRGAGYVLLLNTNGTVKADQKISFSAGGLTGPLVDEDRLGSSAGALGDLDGDGVPDLMSGFRDPGGTTTGALYVLFMNTNGTVKAEQKIGPVDGGLTGPIQTGDAFGQVDLTGAGDLDGDGARDMVVCAQNDDDGGTDQGAAYVLFLNTDGTVKTEQKISATDGGFTGSLADSDLFCSSVTAPGDLNGDGVPDLVVGAQGSDDGGTDRGALWFLFLEGVP